MKEKREENEGRPNGLATGAIRVTPSGSFRSPTQTTETMDPHASPHYSPVWVLFPQNSAPPGFRPHYLASIARRFASVVACSINRRILVLGVLSNRIRLFLW